MALKIISSAQPIEVKNIIVCLYAPPGAGKTSTAFTASKPLLLDFDQGSYRSQFRKDTVQVANWSDVTNITEDDLQPYNTIIVDTVGRALDILRADIVRRNVKGTTRGGGELTQQGYGTLKHAFSSWLTQLRSFGKDVVLLSHMTEQQQKDEFVERLDIQGSSKTEIYKVADLMGRLRFDDANRRVLDFNPSSTGFGKNPVQFDAISVPNFKTEPHFLEDVIQQVKEGLNKQSSEAIQAQKELDEAHSKFSELVTIEQFNLAIDPNMSNLHKKLLLDYARKSGFKFNTETKEFEEAQS